LMKHQTKICWYSLSKNPAIFVNDYDYDQLKNSNVEFKEEIVAMALNPFRINNLMLKYGRDVVYDIYFT
jgi:hypothetical protein